VTKAASKNKKLFSTGNWT